ncbi:hypothetical protein [Paraliomyxa miuraensis]|uniref:hypothetical protein n=1 Tax=Paraliomyxa miuraensis TaxID=376150 RepID=UPI00225035A0|nr:hypothetical protein [Paraliomyxa miuraensis]MCX4247526.1 hypothetical protein [Paraliomyxa miuraensis]
MLYLPTGYDRPVVIASMLTFNGGDTAQVRMRALRECGFEVKSEEEQSADGEVNHVPESIGHIAFPPTWLYDYGGNAIGYATFLDVEQRSANMWIPAPVPTSFTVGDSILFAQVLTFNGGQPVHVRIRHDHPSTGAGGFFFKLEEWPTYDMQHTAERVGLVVLQKGYHALGSASDPRLRVGQVNGVTTGWKSVDVSGTTGAGRPVVVTQCQTFNGGDPVVTRQREVGSFGVDTRVQEAEIGGSHPNAEIVGYVAVGMP